MEEQSIPILVSMEAESTADGQKEDGIRLLTSGTMTRRGNAYVIRYEETLDESQPPQQVELTLEGDTVTMARTGDVSTNMVFTRGSRYESQYQTPYGAMDMAIYCMRASWRMTEEGGDLYLRYQLDLSGQYVAVHDMQLHFLRKAEA